MNVKYYISVIAALLFSFVVMANDDIRIRADECLRAAENTKISEQDFQKTLHTVGSLCKTPAERKYFEEFKVLAETKFKMRPLITAVLGFTCEDSALELTMKPQTVAELLETSLDDSFTKVTRRDLDKAIEELNLQNSDLFEKSTSSKLGSFVGARYIITGNIQKIGEGISITARCIEVETGKIVKDGRIQLKEVSELADAIPALAKKLSIKHLKPSNTSLSNYAVKYLNSANKKLIAENFTEADENINHGSMFLAGASAKNSIVPLQIALTARACNIAKRNYKESAASIERVMEQSKEIFGETDDVVLHCYYSIAKDYLRHGDLEKANQAYEDAIQRFQRTPEGQMGNTSLLDVLKNQIARRIQKQKLTYNTQELEQNNNNFIQGHLGLRDLPASKPVSTKPEIKNNTVSSVSTPATVRKTEVQALSKTTSVTVQTKSTLSPQPRTSLSSNREVKALLIRAQKQFESKQWNQMFATLDKAIVKDPTNASAKQMLKSYNENQLRFAREAMGRSDYTTAISVFKSPRLSLNANDIFQLAVCYEKNGDMSSALENYQKAGEAKNIEALLWLGKYFSKDGDVEKAIQCYSSAAELGENKALLSIALMYLSKRSPLYNESKGIEFMKKAAEAGVPSAQYNLGCCYANFKGATYSCLPYNREMAIKWLRLAKNNGISVASKALRRLE